MKEQREGERKRKKIERKLEMENRDRYGERLTASRGLRHKQSPDPMRDVRGGAWEAWKALRGREGRVASSAGGAPLNSTTPSLPGVELNVHLRAPLAW